MYVFSVSYSVLTLYQEIVDNLLEREPGSAGVLPDAIISDVMVEGEGEVPPALHDSQDTSASDGDISEDSDGSEDEEEDLEIDDNFNSAGEEVKNHKFCPNILTIVWFDPLKFSFVLKYYHKICLV